MGLRPVCFISLLFSSLTLYTFDKITYQFSHDPIDVVIPCHPKDAEYLNECIKSVKKYVQGLRRVIVVSSKRVTDQAEWVDEAIFPFTKDSLALEIFKSEEIAHHKVNMPKTRMGWIYQQFIKLFAVEYIPHISSNVLIVDSDVVFLRPVNFIQSNGAGLYAVGTEFHRPYFEHAHRLLPDLRKLYREHSGIVHHMLFQEEVLEDFFNHIKQQHGIEPWKAIARAIPVDAHNNINASCLSEYEMYFNFVFARTDQVKIRPLQWANVSGRDQITRYKNQGYDYVAAHIYIS